MQTFFRHPATPIWLLLMIATGLSWWLGVDAGREEDLNYHLISTTLIIIAFIKVRFVMRYFMEVRTAPLSLRLICDAWIVVVCSAIVWLF
ncbi:MAG: hypothetical protein DRR06_10665 [Gammaproteobacteria bacterium]|nr:MAG: hypothetical protein DRR06_10665 [Gammaproteobacteria bacterium]RLA53104.1 MAG: hypothetical protein DRR42_05810 [Gammaproteobacteria bacterium]